MAKTERYTLSHCKSQVFNLIEMEEDKNKERERER